MTLPDPFGRTELFAASGINDVALFQHVMSIGEVHANLEILFDQQDSDAARPDRRDHALDLLDDDRRESLGWLVEQEELRVVDQSAGNRQHLLLATGQHTAAIAPSLLEPRKSAAYVFESPYGALARCNSEVLLDRQ